MQCKQCGFGNRNGVRFCENCGASLPEEQLPASIRDTTNQCAQCGFENRDGVKFCEECGASMVVEKQSTPVKASANLCQQCGYENRDGVKFCEDCGAALLAEIPAVPEKITKVKMNLCAQCGFENRPGTRFCEECGAPLAEEMPTVPAKVTRTPTAPCKQCGFENRKGARFCESCGASMAAARPRAPKQAIASSPVPKQGRAFSFVLKAAIAFAVIIGGFMLFYMISPGSFENSFLAPYLPTINISIADNSNGVDPTAPRIADAQPSEAQPSNSQPSNPQPSNAQPSDSQSGSSSSSNSQQGNAQPSAPQAAPENDEDEEDTCHRSRFVSETITDYTVFAPGDKFTKSWTLSNGGECTWDPDYELHFIEGERMGGSSVIELGKTIEPDDTITFSVNLTASSQIGTHTGVWQLFASDGTPMGRYWVIIQVGEEQAPPPEEEQPDDPPPEPPTPPFAITSVTTNLIDVDVTAFPFPKQTLITFTANGPGSAVFQIELSDLGWQDPSPITFMEAGSLVRDYTWTFNSAGNYWMKVHILDPHQTTYGPFNFRLNGP